MGRRNGEAIRQETDNTFLIHFRTDASLAIVEPAVDRPGKSSYRRHA
jgi:hypothetical protein